MRRGGFILALLAAMALSRAARAGSRRSTPGTGLPGGGATDSEPAGQGGGCMRRGGFILALLAAMALSRAARAGSRGSVSGQEAGEACTRFGLDLYSRLRHARGNLLISPFSTFTALAMTHLGARGRTAAEMAKVLHLDGLALSVHRRIGRMERRMVRSRGCVLDVANAVFLRKGGALEPGFVRSVRRAYGALPRRVPFGDHPQVARRQINSWVGRRTRYRIREVLRRGDVNKFTFMVLVNAVYFKGRWAAGFSRRRTRRSPFRTPSGRKVEVDMMYRRGTFGYALVDGVQVLRLPYRGGRFSMVVLLPGSAVSGVRGLESKLTARWLRGALAGLQKTEVDVFLPRFKLGGRFDLAVVLAQMGMGSAFGRGADFSGITRSMPIAIAKVIHRAECEVAEQGTVAAASTAVVLAPLSMGFQPRRVVLFRADHPFLFLIRHEPTGAILFLGRVVAPSGTGPGGLKR